MVSDYYNPRLISVSAYENQGQKIPPAIGESSHRDSIISILGSLKDKKQEHDRVAPLMHASSHLAPPRCANLN